MKNETVIGIIGKTQGVSNARNPIEIAKMINDPRPSVIASSTIVPLSLVDSVLTLVYLPSSITKVKLKLSHSEGAVKVKGGF